MRASNVMGTKEIAESLDELTAEIEHALHLPPTVEKHERLAALHREEAARWNAYLELATRPLAWRAAAAAASRAQLLARHWDAVALAELQDAGLLAPAETDSRAA